MPRLDEFVQMRFGEAEDVVALVAAKAFDEGKLQRVEPELCGVIIALDVNVRRLETVGHVEKEAVASLAQDGRHVRIVAVGALVATCTRPNAIRERGES